MRKRTAGNSVKLPGCGWVKKLHHGPANVPFHASVWRNSCALRTCESYRELKRKKNGAKSEAGSHAMENARADLPSIFVAIAHRGNASVSFYRALGNDGFPREMHRRGASARQ